MCEDKCRIKEFQINIKKLNKNKTSQNVKKYEKIKLNIFESYKLDYSNYLTNFEYNLEYINKQYINVGGPIWSIAWCPKSGFKHAIFYIIIDFPQYLAISTHKTMTKVFFYI